MAGSEGFRTVPLGFDKNDVNNYISTLILKVKQAESEKKEALEVKAQSVKIIETHDEKVRQLKAEYQARHDNLIKQTENYKEKIEELEAKITMLQEQIATKNKEAIDLLKKNDKANNDAEMIAAQNANKIIENARFSAWEILDNAKREQKNITDSVQFLLKTITSEKATIENVIANISRGLEICLEEAQIDESIITKPDDREVDVKLFEKPAKPERHKKTESKPVEKAAAPVEKIAKEIISEPVTVAPVASVEITATATTATAVATMPTATTSSVDEDLAGLFADIDEIDNHIITESKVDTESKAYADSTFEDMLLGGEKTEPEIDDLSAFFGTSDETDDDINQMQYIARDTSNDVVVEEQAATDDFEMLSAQAPEEEEEDFEIKPLDQEHNIFDSLWAFNAVSDDDDDEMSSDNIGINDL